ncbi:MAG: hypothetical protein JSV19_03780 [Phycisphaerales bacterium]|nr:MAG: hypothetical protein JSV19_03780 [Phycisphaerales bacterium]
MMTVGAFRGLAGGGVLPLLLAGCLSWGPGTAYESVTLYITRADTGLPLADATIELMDGADCDQDDLDQCLDDENDAGRSWMKVTDDQGQLTLRFEFPDGTPLAGPLVMRFTSNGQTGKAFAVGLIEGATTIVEQATTTDETVSVTVVDITVTYSSIN